MDALTQQLMQQLAGGGLSQISQRVGADGQTTGSALETVLPVLLSALAKNASTPEGAQSLDRALAKDHDGSVLENIGGLLSDPAVGEGSAILGHILGSRQSTVAQAISRATGLSADQVDRLLQIAAPLVMGALGKQKQIAGFDTNGLASYLNNQRQTVATESPDLMSTLNTLLDADKDGSAVDEVLGMLGKLFGKK